MPEGLSTSLTVSAIQDTIPSTEEKRRAAALAYKRECPHCGGSISLTDALAMAQGDGCERFARVQIEGGSVHSVRLGDINLQTMRILSD